MEWCKLHPWMTFWILVLLILAINESFDSVVAANRSSAFFSSVPR